MDWWMWMAGGLLLSVVELLTPGTLFWIFFAAGAVVTAVVVAIWPEAGPFAQGTVFVAVSVIALTLFRKPIAEWLETSLAAIGGHRFACGRNCNYADAHPRRRRRQGGASRNRLECYKLRSGPP